MCSQQQTCKYLSSIQYLLSCIGFIFCFLTLLSLSFLYYYFVLKNIYNNTVMFFYIPVPLSHFLYSIFFRFFKLFIYIPIFCSNMSSYPVTLSRFLFFFFFLIIITTFLIFLCFV